MKKTTIALLVLAVAMIVPAASATSVTVYISLNGGPETVACTGATGCTFSYSSGGVTIAPGSGVNTNLPGTSLGTSTTTSLDITNASGGDVTLSIRVLAQGYTSPAAPYTLKASESETNFQTGVFTFQTTGSLIGGAACDTTTGTLSEANGDAGASSAPGVFCAGSNPYDLQSLSNYTLGNGAHITSTAGVTASAVPEPTSMMLFGSGLLGFAGVIRRKLGK